MKNKKDNANIVCGVMIFIGASIFFLSSTFQGTEKILRIIGIIILIFGILMAVMYYFKRMKDEKK